jgi:hypothetical protein
MIRLCFFVINKCSIEEIFTKNIVEIVHVVVVVVVIVVIVVVVVIIVGLKKKLSNWV